ncbi:MAG: hypothetical protein RMJ39_09875 [Deltaproteobacteria bacterium]|nr:hypothetical protein [Deltaproteobacteria bacterium]MDW8034483.1 hypothetical protein [Nitrososphaerota archaeon]
MVGECKSKPGKKDMDRLHALKERVKSYLKGPVYGFIVGYTYAPDVEKYAREKYPQVLMLKSYEFELKYSKQTPKRLGDTSLELK